ncbi:TetR/AcrR family transcriptional regulator [Aureimonas fodinaquatilis]|uniref:TetR/AcrR family transcriptional regulator n=2 Tax=Aureimonas fodinaquatilis TaxID=2565783 RepID=A0A5B0DSP7_9HYPH|nr:TetR/AcrR family transcriptional regulator [Aureimonas fodinaquatilis]
MAKSTGKAPRARARIKPEERYQEFVRNAVELFAEVGFDAGTRELAQRLHVTQPLLYRYFPSKEHLIAAVYKEIYLDRWKAEWETMLSGRDLPLSERLQNFYEDYTDTIFTPEWLRIYMFAGLRGVDINSRYVANVENLILVPIVREVRHELGLTTDSPPAPAETELFWTLHGGIFYYGVRKVVYGLPIALDKSQVIANALRTFLAGAHEVFNSPASAGPGPA